MQELELLKKDFIALFDNTANELDKEIKNKVFIATIENFFEYLKEKLEK